MDPDCSCVPDITQMKRPCALLFPGNKRSDICQHKGCCPGNMEWERGYRDPTAFQTSFNQSSFINIIFTETHTHTHTHTHIPSPSEHFYQFLNLLINLKLDFPSFLGLPVYSSLVYHIVSKILFL